LVGTVPPAVFVPRPRVASALVSIVRHEPPDSDPTATFALVDAGFGQRRKMLRSALEGRVDAAAFAAAGIDPAERAERLGVEAWLRLARAAELAAGSA
jgi:16S rRNA (adenine1518-N6/adenine1519-N6)-dimethyltransferase